MEHIALCDVKTKVIGSTQKYSIIHVKKKKNMCMLYGLFEACATFIYIIAWNELKHQSHAHEL